MFSELLVIHGWYVRVDILDDNAVSKNDKSQIDPCSDLCSGFGFHWWDKYLWFDMSNFPTTAPYNGQEKPTWQINLSTDIIGIVIGSRSIFL